ncbi:hypothetical protein N444_16815 [Escherichia coli O6:H16:CFA/II str. B2C]|nr:hypothetical protein N444_16815 [Escherichia coli O6:H16:CFA/II str. B2C]KIZ56323.1 hypothetical protein UH28_25420 [Escherichia coli]KIZ58734.1 hypothetical protein UH34_21270 [Escherichia coli]KIZ68313.1 hypothetical protein UH32_25230 [Escherichia coli]KIZ78102.1 hypothetical protein UH29_24375 [Escherichia coli]
MLHTLYKHHLLIMERKKLGMVAHIHTGPDNEPTLLRSNVFLEVTAKAVTKLKIRRLITICCVCKICVVA